MSVDASVKQLYAPSAWGNLYHSLTHSEALGAGAAGPGKSMVLLMDPFQQIAQEHERCMNPDHPYPLPWGGSSGWALHLRRTRPMLEPSMKRAHRMFPLIDPGAKWNENKATWTFRSGFLFQFGHCHDSEDWQNYLSFEFCVATGTKVLMADGSLRPIQWVGLGEKVMTLEGPRRVTALHSTGLKPCVEVAVQVQGVTVGTQRHSTTHPVLLRTSEQSHREGFPRNRCPSASPVGECGYSWLDYESLLSGRQDSAVKRVSTVAAGIAGARSYGIRPGAEQLPALSFPLALHSRSLRQAQRSFGFATQCAVRGGHCEALPGGPLAQRRPASECQGTTRPSLESCRQGPCRKSDSPACENACAHLESGTRGGSQDGCLACPRSHGGQLHRSLETAPGTTRRQSCAGTHSPTCSPVDYREQTPKRSRCAERAYRHFYSGLLREQTEAVESGEGTARYVGILETFDLTVEDANHYITEHGIVNPNTHIAYDELIQFEEEQYDQINTRLRSSDKLLRAMLKIRSMSNPLMSKQKGDNFSIKDPNWVRKRFVDAAPEGKTTFLKKLKMGDGRVVEHTSIYLPATLYDNPDKEFVEDYEAKLQNAKPHIRQALLYGNWYITAGSFYADVWNQGLHVCKPFKIPKEWPKFRSMDWGFKLPGVIHWYAMDPDGNLIVFRELVFKGMQAKDVAKAVLQIEKGLGLLKGKRSKLTGPADTQLWEDRGDGTKGKAMEMADEGVLWVPAKKGTGSRLRNAELLYDRLGDHDSGTTTPGIVFFEGCQEAIKLIPSVGTSDKNSEEPADGNDDHALDSVFYGCGYASHGKAGLGWKSSDADDKDDEEEEKKGRRGRWGYGSKVM